jgi:polysaccharide biosynthesis/export protein
MTTHRLIAAISLATCVSLAHAALAQVPAAQPPATPDPNASRVVPELRELRPVADPAAPAPASPATTETPTPTPAPSTAAAPTPAAAAANLPLDPRAADMAAAYQIGPEDLLDISVWKNVELSRTVPVRPDGMVSLPLVNDVRASGLTPGELRDQITSKLAEYIPAPEVSVMVREVHSRKVAVVGAVKTPGRYELRSPMTVLEVIALAQGLTDFASRDRIVIIRNVNGQTQRIPFNYRKIADGAGQDNFFVKPGDIVVVP